MKTVIVVRPEPGTPGYGATWAEPTAQAFEACFNRLGWRVISSRRRIEERPDLVAGYGWREVMRTAWERWPERVIHTDLAFWGRDRYLKLALGGRWSPLAERDYGPERLAKHNVIVMDSRTSRGRRILVCGMSEKAAGTFGLRAEEWERMAIRRLLAVGATVTYRSKPSWRGAVPISGAAFDRGQQPIEHALTSADAVVSHHSNAAVDALAAGLPIYVDTGIAKTLSVPTIEAAMSAVAPSLEDRTRFLRQVAWHQWTLAEIADGKWIEPPAPLAWHPLLTSN